MVWYVPKPCIDIAYSALTIEPDNRIEVIFVVAALSLTGQRLHGEGRVGGEGTEAGEEVDRKVGAGGLCLL